MRNEKSGNGEPDPRVVYADIFDLPHHQSDVHPHMSLYDRAAQFAPFAALSGYEDMVDEEARLVDNRIEPGPEDLALLNRALAEIREQISRGVRPAAAITYFIPDPLKPGGRYETITETVKKVDPVAQSVVLEKKTGRAGMNMEIRIADILEISGIPGSPV